MVDILTMGIVSFVPELFPKIADKKNQITLLGLGLTSLAKSTLLKGR